MSFVCPICKRKVDYVRGCNYCVKKEVKWGNSWRKIKFNKVVICKN